MYFGDKVRTGSQERKCQNRLQFIEFERMRGGPEIEIISSLRFAMYFLFSSLVAIFSSYFKAIKQTQSELLAVFQKNHFIQHISLDSARLMVLLACLVPATINSP